MMALIRTLGFRKAAVTRTACGAMALAVAATLFAAPALADVRIGVVNMAQVLDQAPQSRSVVEALQDEFAPRQREIIARQNELNEQEERLQRDAAVMGEEERRNVERQLRDGQRDLNRRQNEFVEDLNLRRNEELGNLQRQLLQEIQAYARNSEYDMIVGEGIIYASEQLDITDEVLALLERNYRNGR